MYLFSIKPCPHPPPPQKNNQKKFVEYFTFTNFHIIWDNSLIRVTYSITKSDWFGVWFEEI